MATRVMRVLATAIVMAAVAGCASTPGPAEPASRSAGAGPVVAAPQPPPQPVTEPGKPAATNAGDTAVEADSYKPPGGYRTVKRDGVTMYCTKIKELGSNLSETACFTQAQLEEVERRTEATRRELERMKSTCAATGGSCGGG